MKFEWSSNKRLIGTGNKPSVRSPQNGEEQMTPRNASDDNPPSRTEFNELYKTVNGNGHPGHEQRLQKVENTMSYVRGQLHMIVVLVPIITSLLMWILTTYATPAMKKGGLAPANASYKNAEVYHYAGNGEIAR